MCYRRSHPGGLFLSIIIIEALQLISTSQRDISHTSCILAFTMYG